MDATTNHPADYGKTHNASAAPVTKKGPRAANTYRGAVRNAWKAARRLPEWREKAAAIANQRAGMAARQVVANGAREAAAKAAMGSANGLPAHVNAAKAMLNHYRAQKHTRPVNRIIRDLERQIRAA